MIYRSHVIQMKPNDKQVSYFEKDLYKMWLMWYSSFMDSKVYIYGLACPERGTIRYVGKSKKPKSRYSSHLSHAKAKRYDNIHLYRWIAKLLRNDAKPTLVILESCDNNCWKEKEKAWIAKIGMDNLLNMHEGGIEPPDCTGRVWDEKMKKHFSEMSRGRVLWTDRPHPMKGLKGENNPNYGQKRTKEFCALMKKQKTEYNGMSGVKLSKERVEQIRLQHSKPVALIDSEGSILKRYKSQKDATIDLGLTEGAVSRVCNGEYKQTKGYRFLYL